TRAGTTCAPPTPASAAAAWTARARRGSTRDPRGDPGALRPPRAPAADSRALRLAAGGAAAGADRAAGVGHRARRGLRLGAQPALLRRRARAGAPRARAVPRDVAAR